ncbi:MAG: hypothetical protein M1826_002574 [Phylliscum demangeonii]|nr:MAG: hypothetical protein M1826_002574 [Phylliscum demangeonii]
MAVTTEGNLRKRPHPVDDSDSEAEAQAARQLPSPPTTERATKRHKYDHSSTGPRPLVAAAAAGTTRPFVSKWVLTKRALKELDRNLQEADATPARPPHRPPPSIKESKLSPSALARFARRGGPDLQDLRGSADSAPQSTDATSDSRIKNSSTYDKNFLQHLMERCIDAYNIRIKPTDWEELLSRLMPPRASLSPTHFSEDDFVDFLEKLNKAAREEDVMVNSLPFIHGDFNFPSKKNVVFNNLVPLTEHKLVYAKPDFVDGADPATISPRVCRELLIDVTETFTDKDQVERTRVVRKSYIIPCRSASYPALPNFSVEVKGPGGTGVVAMRQACYNGVLGARAMFKLRNYARGCGDEPVYDGRTESIACTYSDGTLKIYTFHLRPPDMPGGDPHYYMTQLCSFSMTNSSNTFREGASAFRNLRIWASEQRTHAITAANARADRLSAMLPPSTTASMFPQPPPPTPLTPPSLLNSSAIGTLALAGPLAYGVTVSHNTEQPPPLLSPSASPDAPDGIEMDAELGPWSANVADPPPPLPFPLSASLDDAQMSDPIEPDAEAGRLTKRARRAT